MFMIFIGAIVFAVVVIEGGREVDKRFCGR